MSFKQRTLQTIKKFKMFKRGDRVLVGFSGGPDSLALVYVLNSLRKELGISLHLAHLNHMLRQNESKRDMGFSKKIAERLNLPIDCKCVDIKSLAKKGSLEEIARKQRQKFFINLAKKHCLQKIALGHNQDDQAETVLMRIIRGSGLYGLSAILPLRAIDGHTFARPLIDISRAQINAYLKRIKVKPRIDTSNLESVFFRNRIRNRLLPILESEFNKNARSSLANLAQVVSLDYEYLVRQAQRSLKRVVLLRSKSLHIDSKKFSKLHISMQRMLLRLCISHLAGNLRRFDYRHWQELEDLVQSRPLGSIVDLPSAISVSKQEKSLRFYIRKLK